MFDMFFQIPPPGSNFIYMSLSSPLHTPATVPPHLSSEDLPSFLKWKVETIWLSYCSWGSQGKNIEVVWHSVFQWTTFCQNSPTWPVWLGWPYMAWLIVSLSWTRLWSMWSVWLIYCDCDFHSVCSLMVKDKRLVEASWWKGLADLGLDNKGPWSKVWFFQ